jgi:hypothetical protein
MSDSEPAILEEGGEWNVDNGMLDVLSSVDEDGIKV